MAARIIDTCRRCEARIEGDHCCAAANVELGGGGVIGEGSLDGFGLNERRRERMGQRAGFAAHPEREARVQERAPQSLQRNRGAVVGNIGHLPAAVAAIIAAGDRGFEIGLSGQRVRARRNWALLSGSDWKVWKSASGVPGESVRVAVRNEAASAR